MNNIAGSSILVVDDNKTNLSLIVETLSNEYSVNIATNGKSAIEIATNTLPDLILLDIMMPGMDGFEVIKQLKENEVTKDILVIFLTAVDQDRDITRGFNLGATDYITKPFKLGELHARVKTQLYVSRARKILKNQNTILEQKVIERTKDLMLVQDVVIECVASLAESRDPETGGHIKRTQNYVKVLAMGLKDNPAYSAVLTEARISNYHKTAPLHDIGKVGIPDHILLKPGKLTFEEFEIMKKHAQYGRDALASSSTNLGSSSFLKPAEEISLCHHEKWDGSGYPNGLKGEDIPLSARLMALADVYDALISKRVYKPPFSHKKARGIILEGKGTHFDPDIVEVFCRAEGAFYEIARNFADSDEEREGLGSL